jgi:hypothetical protein
MIPTALILLGIVDAIGWRRLEASVHASLDTIESIIQIAQPQQYSSRHITDASALSQPHSTRACP